MRTPQGTVARDRQGAVQVTEHAFADHRKFQILVHRKTHTSDWRHVVVDPPVGLLNVNEAARDARVGHKDAVEALLGSGGVGG